MTSGNTYVKTEIVGTSDVSVSEAINTAIGTASKSLRNLDWFEVVETRGHLEKGKIAHWQVKIKLGFRMEA